MSWAPRIRICIPLFLAAVLSGGGATAQDSLPASPVSLRQWTTEDGLPAHQINDIQQTPDDYLWLATFNGLVRFDGFEFRVFRYPELPSSGVSALGLAADGRLLIATDQGLLSYDGKRFSPLEVAGRQPIWDIVETGPGEYWLNNVKLIHVNAGGIVSTSKALRFFGKFVTDRQGTVWANLKDSGTGYVEDTGFVLREGSSQAGERVVATAGGDVLFARAVAGRTEVRDIDGRLHGSYPALGTPLLLDAHHRLLSHTGTGLVLHSKTSEVPVFSATLGRSIRVISQAVDREGNIWLGTETRGLLRLSDMLFRSYGEAQGLVDGVVNSMTEDTDGSILFTTRDGHLYRVPPGPDAMVETIPDPGGPGSDIEKLEQVLVGRNGTHWFRRSKWLIGERNDSRIFQEQTPQPKRLFDDPAWDVTWVFSAGELRCLAPHDPALCDAAPQGQRLVPNGRGLLRDRQGILWIASDDGLFRIDGNSVRRFSTDDGLPISRVRALHEDSDDTLWVGTYGGGLVRWDEGSPDVVTSADGLYEDVVNGIVEDQFGTFWMAGDRGVQRVLREDLVAFLDGRRDSVNAVGYGRWAGLANPETSGVAPLQASDGRIWFPTFGGPVVVDPREVQTWRAGLSLPLHIEQVLHEGKPLAWEGDELVLRADQRRFDVRFTAISLGAPEALAFRYRLQGFDPSWIEAGEDRRARYANVPAGTYSFQVRAVDRYGASTQREATLAISVQPRFFETAWFPVVAVLVVAAVGGAGYRLRFAQVRRRQRHLDELVHERTRELEAERDRTKDVLNTMARQAHQLEDQ